MNGGLRTTTVRGASWTGLAQGAGYLVTLSSLGLAARFLEVDAFGVEAAAVTVVGIGAILADLGVGRALVQRRDLRPGHLAAGFWIGLLTSCTLAGMFWGTAGLWARLFGDGRVAEVLPAMSWGVVCTGLGAVPRSQMERTFRFRALAAVDFCAALLGGAVLVVLAVRGHGFWSLVWAYLARSTVLAAGPWVLCPALQGLRFRPEEAGALAGFGGKWAAGQLIGYGQQNLDYLLIGRFLGTEALGYYFLAYRLVAFLQTRLVGVVTRVTFPAFAAIQADLPRMRRAYLSTVTCIALSVFPVMAGFALLADPGISLYYGAEKAPAAGVLQLLAPGGAARSVGAAVGLIFLALGRTGLVVVWNCGAACAMLGAVWVGLGGGIEGVALAVSLSGVALAGVSQGIVNRLIGIRYGAYLRALQPALLGCAAMAAGTLAGRWLLEGALSSLILTVACAGLGGLAYLAGLRALAPEAYREVRALMTT